MNKEAAIPGHQYPLTPQYYLGELASPSDTDVLVTKEDFLQAFSDLVPSVSRMELEHYGVIRQRFTSNVARDGEQQT